MKFYSFHLILLLKKYFSQALVADVILATQEAESRRIAA
jgi:hypothetical protein